MVEFRVGFMVRLVVGFTVGFTVGFMVRLMVSGSGWDSWLGSGLGSRLGSWSGTGSDLAGWSTRRRLPGSWQFAGHQVPGPRSQVGCTVWSESDDVTTTDCWLVTDTDTDARHSDT